MGLFRRRGTSSDVAKGWERGEAWLSWGPPRNVLREGHYQEAITRVCGPVCEVGYLWPVSVTLRREPTNPHDQNAIKAHVGRHHVGYMRAKVAVEVAPVVDDAGLSSWTVAGLIRGGSTEADMLGVHLWLDRLVGPGARIILPDGLHEPAWPPHSEELELARRP